MEKQGKQASGSVIMVVILFIGLILIIDTVLMNSQGYKCTQAYLNESATMGQYGRLKKIGLFFNSAKKNNYFSGTSIMHLEFLPRMSTGIYFAAHF